ncbi:hypothetical protein B9J77_04935 [candidate division NPL-UPA2 bacterium Unc8]|uniref:Outer membrane lipoprotein carrier protein LolA n=1 Tax=candidate division NPL-UPA2 bacterium Unc8 TaxID=1980939 RepID=A0A399FVW2_UNCN2|nr:hypothetical protein [Bacillota bacterium]MBT9147342.1 hypothetical protein [Bacillota bacterium]RIH99625.1 MAG: hypothetical protein B9J77_04935 [candidate division NPL-UPA2 bacterium Unc8]
MKKILCGLLFFVFLTGVCEASGVEGILKRARERYLKFREVATDITILRTITAEGRTMKEKIYKKGEMFRIEGEEDGVTRIRIYDGESFWTVIPERGIRQKLPLEAKGDALLDKWFDTFGREELKIDRVKRDFYVLAGRDNLFLWIDRETLALLKLEAGDEEERIAVAFSNFRTIEGWGIPLTARMLRDGRVIGSFSSKLDLRTVLCDSLFCAESIEIEDPLPLEPPPPPD